ncbi:GNAT family N-acetyltransferase [Streptococcus oricebi]|uniref:GNAT family N-acetyltransferase n=1 Tax=Streptococcus oricebi TaxID=1547447 RepID=A0ABS5B3M4_9STRE|nr:GNAT family N-acetyltransferase [Streptococcus oricebi]
MNIRKASLTDWQDLQTVCQTSWRDTYKNIYSPAYLEKVFQMFYSEERLRQDIIEHSAQWHGYWLAEENGQVLGCIGGGMNEEGEGNVYLLYVLPSQQRKGLGHALLATLTKHQKEVFQARKQWVSVAEGNQIGIPFYEKEGFEFVVASENWIDPSQARDLQYVRKI